MKTKLLLKLTLLLIVLGSTEKLLAQVKDTSNILWTANWSYDNKYIAVGGDDKRIRIYDGETFELKRIYDNQSGIQRMSWHPHSNFLAVASNESKIIDIFS